MKNAFMPALAAAAIGAVLLVARTTPATVLLPSFRARARAGGPVAQPLADLSAHGVTPTSPPWRGWDRYQVIMWSTGSPRDLSTWFARLKQMGCTAEETGRGSDPAVFARNGFGFYVENLVPGLGFLNDRRPIYQADFEGYTSTHDRRYLIRKPCFDDPAFWQQEQRTLPEEVRPFASCQPLLYNLRDELSIGSYASPMDYCFGPYTLAAFRRWLQQQYSSLAALNAEWETHFPSWDQVTPLTTYEIKARERLELAAGRRENLAPWADHRAFMDRTFSRTITRLRDIVRQVDPATPVGVEGTQMPSAWGGYDLWRLSQSVDWVEAYDIANSREIFRSFLPARAPVLSTVFGSDFPQIRRQLWRRLLDGDRGCIIWDDDHSRCIEKTAEGMQLTERGKGLAALWPELKPVARILVGLRRVEDPIAIHYSQASIRAHWMSDSREDGNTWPRRFSSYEATHSRFSRVRDSFVRLVQDLELQPRFVSYEQLERGDLMRRGDRVLLLPQSVAMSRRECAQVAAFVRRVPACGCGTVIADNMTATMDEHCKRLPAGQLDALFSIRRRVVGWRPSGAAGALRLDSPGAIPLQVFEPDIVLTTGKALRTRGRAPAVVDHRAGKGRAIYLNLDLHDYCRDRLRLAANSDLRSLFRRLLAQAGVQAPVTVVTAADGRPAARTEVWRYRGSGAETIAVMRNPDLQADPGGQFRGSAGEALDKPEEIAVRWPKPARVTDLRSGRAIGLTNHVTVQLDPGSPLILELRQGADRLGLSGFHAQTGSAHKLRDRQMNV